jgi:PAS domain S-box-containing protein
MIYMLRALYKKYKEQCLIALLSPPQTQSLWLSIALFGIGLLLMLTKQPVAALIVLVAFSFYTGAILSSAQISTIIGSKDSQILSKIKWLDLFLREKDLSTQKLRSEVDNLKHEKDGLLEHYHVLTNNLAAAVVIRDSEHKISYCSPYTEVLTGYAVSEIYDSQEDFFLKIIHPEDREKFKRALRVAAAGEPFQFRYRLYHRSAIEMWAETRTVPVMSDDGQMLFSLSVTLDVTGMIRYQQQVEEKNRDLRDFTYMVSHDLKAPIFTIKGMLGLIDQDIKDDAEQIEEPLQHISQATNRLDALVKSVLEYSRISSQDFQIESVNLQEVFSELLVEVKPELEKIGAEIEIENELPTVRGNKLALYQVLSNLVGNAIKYRSPERKLKLWITPHPSSDRDKINISFQDNGLGIPNNKLDDIFRPFQRAHAHTQIEGSGIGLASVKRILEKVGGDIRVESTEGSGSTFEISLVLEKGRGILVDNRANHQIGT